MKKLLLAIITLFLFSAAGAQCKYSLEDLLKNAEDNSVQHLIDSLKVSAAKAEQLQARTAFFPKISVATSFLSLRRPLKLFDAKELSEDFLGIWSPFLLETEAGKKFIQKVDKRSNVDLKNSWLLNVGIVQPLFVGGKIVASNKMADYAFEALQWQVERSKAEYLHTIKEAYYQLVSLCEKETLLQEYLRMLGEVADDVAVLTEEGYATKGDLLDVKMALTKATQGHHQIQKMLPVASQHLALLVALPLSEEIVPEDNVESLLSKTQNIIFAAPDKGNNTDYLSCTENQKAGSRMHLVALTKEIRHQQTLIKQSSMMPQLAFFANYSAICPNLFNSMKKNVGGAWSLGVTLQIPITDIYGGYQARRSAKANELIASLEEKETFKKLTLEKEKALAEVLLAKESFLLWLQLRKDIASNLDLAILGYKEGEVSIERLLRTEADWLKINEEFISALTNLFIKESAQMLSSQ